LRCEAGSLGRSRPQGMGSRGEAAAKPPAWESKQLKEKEAAD
jgi:hypothetical protein